MSDVFQLKSISQLHEVLGLPEPEHPLISFIEDQQFIRDPSFDKELFGVRGTSDMYSIMYKDKLRGSVKYGKNTYDFQEGTLIFFGPGQVFTSLAEDEAANANGWTLVFHPDLVRKSALGEKMEQYTFFSYNANEALHLSAKEEHFCVELTRKIQEEYSQNMDQHSHTLIITNLELLLNYCLRFYDRQFYTRTNIHKDFVIEFEAALRAYCSSPQLSELGLPSAGYFGEQLNMSANYLSDMLKKETGKGTKEHIDSHIVEKAKSLLLNTPQRVSEVAYSLGFDYPQSFTRLFKNKTGMSPAVYRKLN